jgi:hypothetical protein
MEITQILSFCGEQLIMETLILFVTRNLDWDPSMDRMEF